jgi:hypothetical protein
VSTPQVKAASTISTASVKVSASVIKKIRATWKTYGVSKKTQDKLIAKLKAGKTWDSLKKSKAKKTKHYDKGGYAIRVYTYADGSIRVAKAKLRIKTTAPSGSSAVSVSAADATITDCKVYYLSHYTYELKGCHATADFVLYKFWADFDYIVAQGGYATIEKVYHVDGKNYLGTFDTSTEKIEDNWYAVHCKPQLASFTTIGVWMDIKVAGSGIASATVNG